MTYFQVVVALALVLATGTMGHAADTTKRWTVSLPTTWRVAESVLLVLHDLDLPRDRAVIIRVYAGEERKESLLGSTSQLAEDPHAQGRWSRARVIIPIRESLARVLAGEHDRAEIAVLLVPVDGKGRHLDDLDWSVGTPTIETR